MPNVFLALPSQGTTIPETIAAVQLASRKHTITGRTAMTGHIPHCFNVLFCEAYNSRDEGKYAYWAMIHSDVRAEPFYLDRLIDEMERVNADVLSVVIPIGDERNLSSIGIQRPGIWNTRRITMREAFKLPETFSIADTEWPDRWLAINTGLWVFRFDRPWVDEFTGFNIHTQLIPVEGKRFAAQYSEDWGFSSWANKRGLKLFATRAVKAWHRKTRDHPNFEYAEQAWDTDKEFKDFEAEDI